MPDTKKIVDKAWNFAHVLRDDGLSYMAYTEQITFLLFLKMADEQSKPPYTKRSVCPKNSIGPEEPAASALPLTFLRRRTRTTLPQDSR